VEASACSERISANVLSAETRTPDGANSLMDVQAVADLIGVSASWVRRHISELPCVRLGRLIRFDSILLFRQLGEKIRIGKSLKPERINMLFRYQRGHVFQLGKHLKVWYGMFREDIRKPDGQIERQQRKVRLGTLAELPTKNAARNRLTEFLQISTTSADMSFQELAERWERAEGATIKGSTLNHYQHTLRASVLPTFGKRKIAVINREDIQNFLTEQARKYSESSLRSMRVVLGLTLGWANDCGWIAKNPCTRIKLPKRTGGRKVIRTVLTPRQVQAIAEKLEEPYATLVLFLAASGLRIGEAVALRWPDFNGNVLHVRRRIFDGEVDSVKSKTSERTLPVDSALLERMKKLGEGEWVFRSRTGTPINPGNALKRYIQPAAKELGIALGGWHDFRHTLTTTMRRNGVHPKVISGILGHAKVNLAMDTYDRATVDDFERPMTDIVKQLLPSCYQNKVTA
jgi:integrase